MVASPSLHVLWGNLCTRETPVNSRAMRAMRPQGTDVWQLSVGRMVPVFQVVVDLGWIPADWPTKRKCGITLGLSVSSDDLPIIPLTHECQVAALKNGF